jgi:ribosomal protein S13
LKFEQLLKIYWARGFLYGGHAEKYDVSFHEFFVQKKGLNLNAKKKFIKRFDLYFMQKTKKSFLYLDLEYRKVINMYLSQLSCINYSIDELIRYNIIRLYLIKSFRGRCLALGKPSRGQRTWSNAWTAFKNNTVLRKFISDVKKFNTIVKKTESLNKKILKKKVRQKAPKIKMIFTKKKKNFWF